MKFKSMKKFVKSGFSLMEMVIVVIIIGILLGAVTKMTSATKTAKVTTLMQGFQNLATAAMQYQNQNNGSYDKITLKQLEKNNIISVNDWGKKGERKNPFAGGFELKSLDSGNAFEIIATGIPKDICDKIKVGGSYKVPGADNFKCEKGKTVKASYGTTSIK